jgi:hypothetical protein
MIKLQNAKLRISDDLVPVVIFTGRLALDIKQKESEDYYELLGKSLYQQIEEQLKKTQPKKK